MKTSLFFTAALTFLLAGPALAEVAHPCKDVKEACLKGGFVKGGAKDGKGLWVDCIDPIMQGTAPKKSVLTLPTVDAATVTACKTKRPKFGAGKGAK